MHYVPFAAKDEKLRAILRGIIGKQASQILTDPYANAFNEVPDGRGHQDKTQLNDWVWERKYELDSLCAPSFIWHMPTGRRLAAPISLQKNLSG